MKLQLKRIKDINNIIRGTLYKVEDSVTIKFEENHKDNTKDVVYVSFNLKNNIYGIYSNEYKPSIIESNGCKKVDIICGLIDEDSKKCITYILDVKRNISGFNVNDELEKLREEAVKRIKNFIKQIEDSITIKEMLMVILKKEGFSEEGKVGIATREFNVDRFRALADKLYKASEEDSNAKINSLISTKFKRAMLPIKKEAEILKLFSEKKIKINSNIYDLEVYILENSNNNEYVYTLDI